MELESRAEEHLSDMEREAVLETIQNSKESIKHSNDMIRSLQDTIRSLQSELDRSRSHSEQYLILITDLQKKLDEREKEISDLHDLNNRHNKMTFGNKSTSRKHKRPAQKQGRDEAKENSEGRTTPEETDSKESEEALDKTKVKSEHLDAKRGPRGPYTQMDAARKVVLKSSLDGVPADWVFDH